MGETKTEKKGWNLFKCLSCEGEPEFTPEEIKEHLSATHNISGTLGYRKFLCHLDFADSYQSDYEWTIGGVKLAQQIRGMRKVPW